MCCVYDGLEPYNHNSTTVRQYLAVLIGMPTAYPFCLARILHTAAMCTKLKAMSKLNSSLPII
jgi:hypothetical protein